MVRTTRTADWHTRFRAEVAVYGHLHIPRTTHYDGVRFEEVSLGYPREWGTLFCVLFRATGKVIVSSTPRQARGWLRGEV